MLSRARFVLMGVILVSLLGAARSAHADGIGIGAKFGPLFSNFNSDVTDFKTRTGLIGGIFIGGHREGTAGIQVDILYAKKRATDPLTLGDVDLHYLEIPVLGRFNFGSHSLNGVAGYIIVGPSVDIKLKAALSNGLDVGDNYEGFNLGLIGGAGIEITRFIVEGRYNWGFRSVNKGDFASSSEIKDKTFALMFGIRFN